MNVQPVEALVNAKFRSVSMDRTGDVVCKVKAVLSKPSMDRLQHPSHDAMDRSGVGFVQKNRAAIVDGIGEVSGDITGDQYGFVHKHFGLSYELGNHGLYDIRFHVSLLTMLVDGAKLYWHVHHDRLVELCYDAGGREKFIRLRKLQSQVDVRLRLMKPVKGSCPPDVSAMLHAMMKDGVFRDMELRAQLRHHAKYFKDLHKKECPNCPWDGKTIFPPQTR